LLFAYTDYNETKDELWKINLESLNIPLNPDGIITAPATSGGRWY
jgi:hypothetical protein